jgi:hypothetical protein
MNFYCYNGVEAPTKQYLFVWPTYRIDQYHIIESVKSVQYAMRGHEEKATYVALEDSLCPLDREPRQLLKQMGVDIITTDYFRNNNNIGEEALSGQLREWCRLEEKYTFDYLVKIDCDTLVYDLKWLWAIEADESKTLVGTFKTIPYYVFGAIYGLKREVLKPLYEDACKYKAWRGSFEDYETGVRLYRMSGGDLNYAIRYRVSPEDGFILCSLRDARDEMHMSRYVNFGWDLQATPAHQRMDYKQKQLDLMKRMNGLRIKDESETKQGE